MDQDKVLMQARKIGRKAEPLDVLKRGWSGDTVIDYLLKEARRTMRRDLSSISDDEFAEGLLNPARENF